MQRKASDPTRETERREINANPTAFRNNKVVEDIIEVSRCR